MIKTTKVKAIVIKGDPMGTILDHILFKHKKFAELTHRTEKQQILNACIRLLEFEAEIILHGIIIDLNKTEKLQYPMHLIN